MSTNLYLFASTSPRFSFIVFSNETTNNSILFQTYTLWGEMGQKKQQKKQLISERELEEVKALQVHTPITNFIITPS